jgi:hypothetical protein
VCDTIEREIALVEVQLSLSEHRDVYLAMRTIIWCHYLFQYKAGQHWIGVVNVKRIYPGGRYVLNFILLI